MSVLNQHGEAHQLMLLTILCACHRDENQHQAELLSAMRLILVELQQELSHTLHIDGAGSGFELLAGINLMLVKGADRVRTASTWRQSELSLMYKDCDILEVVSG